MRSDGDRPKERRRRGAPVFAVCADCVFPFVPTVVGVREVPKLVVTA
jgi:hypothetical protein